MNLHARLRHIERTLEAKKLDTKVHFFKSVEEFDQAKESITFGRNDVIFIDDVPEDD